MDTADTGLAGCGLLAGVRLLITGRSSEDLAGCYIPAGTTLYFSYGEDTSMDPALQEPAPEPIAPAPVASTPPTGVDPVPTPVAEVVQIPGPTAENLGDLAQKVDDPVLVVILAIIALLGVGLWKHLGKVADQKAALDMKRLEIEQMSVKKGQSMTSQPPPCQAANAAIEARLAAFEARLGKVESTSVALPSGFNAEEMEERVHRLEMDRLKGDA